MRALMMAIYNLYTAGTPHNALYTALYVSAALPGFYLDMPPQAAPFPYCIFGLQACDFDPSMTDTEEPATVYFNAYTQENAGVAMDLVDKLTAVFDDAAVTVTGYSALYMTRDTIIPLHDLGDDTPVFGYAVHYDVLLET